MATAQRKQQRPFNKSKEAAASLPAEGWFAPVDIASLAVFRIAFGAILLVEVLRFVLHGWVWEGYVAPVFHFTYYGFEWLRPWPAPLMFLHFLLLGAAAATILLGWHMRWGAMLFGLGFAYVFLLEKSLYMNHFYFVCLLCGALALTPADRQFSLAAQRWPAWRTDYVPAWSLWLMRLMIAIPYFYGGLAKLNHDWLHGQPMQLWMARMTWLHETIPGFGGHALALAFSYGGLLLDLCIVPLLLWRRTRLVAFVAAVAFHVMNSVMFQIGIFPWFMICGTTLFVEPSWPRRAFRSLPAAAPRPTNFVRQWPPGGRWGMALVGIAIALLLLTPFIHWAYPGDASWTEEGSQFAWRMMLNDKTSAAQWIAVDRRTGQLSPVDVRPYLTPRQLDKMSCDPEMMREFAHFIRGEYERAGRGDVAIHAIAFCSLNGRTPQLLVDPKVDLSRIPRSLAHADWIVPLVEPLPEQALDLPPAKWAEHYNLTPLLPASRSSE